MTSSSLGHVPSGTRPPCVLVLLAYRRPSTNELTDATTSRSSGSRRGRSGPRCARGGAAVDPAPLRRLRRLLLRARGAESRKHAAGSAPLGCGPPIRCLPARRQVRREERESRFAAAALRRAYVDGGACRAVDARSRGRAHRGVPRRPAGGALRSGRRCAVGSASARRGRRSRSRRSARRGSVRTPPPPGSGTHVSEGVATGARGFSSRRAAAAQAAAPYAASSTSASGWSTTQTRR